MALSLLGLLLLFGLRFLGVFQEQILEWRFSRQLEQQVYQVNTSMRYDLRHRGVQLVSDSLTIRIPTNGDDQPVVYEITRNQIMRHDQVLTTGRARLDSFRLDLTFIEPRIETDTIMYFDFMDKLTPVAWQPPDTLHYVLQLVSVTYQLSDSPRVRQGQLMHQLYLNAFDPVTPYVVFPDDTTHFVE